jgi:hypothetical protein
MGNTDDPRKPIVNVNPVIPKITVTPITRVTGPFSEGDSSTLNPDPVVADANALKAKMEQVRVILETTLNMSRPANPPAAPGADPTPPRDGPGANQPKPGGDGTGTEPKGKPPRKDLILPFLLIRSFPADMGARPTSIPQWTFCPDVLVKDASSDPIGRILTRDEAQSFMAAFRYRTWGPAQLDVWVHVWNLGRAPAYGVRVRTWAAGPSGKEYLGGTSLNLPDRVTPGSHVLIKVASWHPAQPPGATGLMKLKIRATAECLTDVAKPNSDPAHDRHTAENDQDIAVG